MRIGIITIHYGSNYGSSLQVYALYNKVKSVASEADVHVINYIPERYNFKNRFLCTKKNLGLVKKIIYLILSAPLKITNESKFISFQKKFVRLDKKCSYRSIRERYGNFDFVIVGSDQVWNSDYNAGFDENYFINFASDKTKRIAYAASCGKEDYSTDEWEKIINQLSKFKLVSVREKDTCEKIVSKGINCQWVLDPTFFIDKKQWELIAQKPSVELSKYVLIYCLDSDEKELIPIAKKIACEKGLKTVILSYGHFWLKYDVDCTLLNQTPQQFLWLMNNAEYVVTNSFHGICFSINLEKQFFAVKRKKYNNRLDSVLSLFNLQNRYVYQNSCIDAVGDIDYKLVDEIKEKELRKSEEFLKRALL